MNQTLAYLSLIFTIMFASLTDAFGLRFVNQANSQVQFVDISEQAGVSFRHYDGRSQKRYFIETLGAGVGLFDYDNDGYPDIYFVNGANLDAPQESQAMNRLYRNNGDGTFVDVTEQAGVGDKNYGLGCCVGDYDNDGFLDLYVTNYRSNILYHNNGDGTFVDVTRQAGVDDANWSAGCAFADVDNDGDLDLYISNYIQFETKKNKIWRIGRVLVYSSPRVYEGLRDTFFRNNGDGTFTEDTEAAGFGDVAGRGLGIVFGDYDNDGDVDLFVANDANQDCLYQNDGSGHFEEVGLIAGVAFSEHGIVGNGMGTDFGDYDNDGLLDIIVTNFHNQINTLFHNDGDGFFTDVSHASHTGDITMPDMAWGADFFDYDNDGFLDLLIANGHYQDNIRLYDKSTTYAQMNHLFHNNRDGTFTDVAKSTGPGMQLLKVSRGTAIGDIDNDGDLDIVISNSNQTANVLRNDGGNQSGNWLNIKLIGKKSNRSAIGARATVTAGDLRQIREVRSSSSFLSQNDLRLHFGLGKHEKVTVEIRWPSGLVERFENIAANQFLTIIEGNTSTSR